MPNQQPIDPTIIEAVPLSDAPDFDADQSALSLQMIATLSEENAALKARIDAKNPATVRAEMMKPYANAVYWYLVGYTVIVGAVLISHGFGWRDFSLPSSVLVVLVGSTAVAAIGLVRSVVGGLFAPTSHS